MALLFCFYDISTNLYTGNVNIQCHTVSDMVDIQLMKCGFCVRGVRNVDI